MGAEQQAPEQPKPVTLATQEVAKEKTAQAPAAAERIGAQGEPADEVAVRLSAEKAEKGNKAVQKALEMKDLPKFV